MGKSYCDEAVERFRQKLNDGYFRKQRSINNEVCYPEEKEERDTKAIFDSADSGLYKVLFERS